jgi:hypothetical protein
MSTAVHPASISTTRDDDQFFYGPVTDYLLVGGFSIIFYFMVSLFMSSRDFTLTFLYLAGLLAWIVNWPHFAATNLRLYGSRDAIRQYPLTATLIPVVILVGMLAALYWPQTVAPYFVKLFLIWSPYHFSGQTVGITLIYARRAGYQFTRFERTALSSFVFGTFFYTLALTESHLGTDTYYDIAIPTFGIPDWTPQVVAPWMWGSLALFLCSFVHKCYAHGKLFPLIILVPSIAQLFWFIIGSRLAGYYEFVPFFHSLQYLLVASSMKMVEQSERAPGKSQVMRSMIGWGAGILLLGVALFWLFPRVLESWIGVPMYLALGVSAAAVQLHHFFVDGVIWKLKRKTVSHPLMLNARRVFRSLPSS